MNVFFKLEVVNLSIGEIELETTFKTFKEAKKYGLTLRKYNQQNSVFRIVCVTEEYCSDYIQIPEIIKES